MPQMKLKTNAPDFDEVDGTHEGRKYRAGQIYDEKDIPPGKRNLFELVAVAATQQQTAAKTVETPEEPKKESGGKTK